MAGNSQIERLSVRKLTSLREALDLKPGEVVSLVGGGGKTSLMFALAHELARAGKRVITTTTTRIMPPRAEESDCVIIEMYEARLIRELRKALAQANHVTAVRLRPDENHLKGLLPETVDNLAQMGLADYIINEADGAARRPIKAPNATEPVVPRTTTLLVAVVGIDALGARLDREKAFRPELISALTGLALGDAITQEAVATLLTHPSGIIQYRPAGARIVPFINKTDLASSKSEALNLAEAVLARRHPQIERVVLAALCSPERQLTVVQARGG